MEKILEYVKKHGYDHAEYLGEYKKFKVYEAIYSKDDVEEVIGLPAFIFESNDELEWVQDNRSLDVLSYFYKEEEEI